MSTELTRSELEQLVSLNDAGKLVSRTLEGVCASPALLVRFLGRYASWTVWFGSGVAALAGKIGRSRALFVDPEEPVLDVADRSVLVGSYFFDAARDEFDDRDTPHRDTHRCLAQALLKGTLGFFAASDARLADAAFVNAWLAPPAWLKVLAARVAQGYGASSSDEAASVFRAMGYHLGSEVLADREFSLIDETLRERQPALVQHLEATRVSIAGQSHVAYQWLNIHSGHGGAVEADHFEWATRGVRMALSYTPADDRKEMRRQVHLGFVDFARDHREFFEQALLD